MIKCILFMMAVHVCNVIISVKHIANHLVHSILKTDNNVNALLKLAVHMNVLCYSYKIFQDSYALFSSILNVELRFFSVVTSSYTGGRLGLLVLEDKCRSP